MHHYVYMMLPVAANMKECVRMRLRVTGQLVTLRVLEILMWSQVEGLQRLEDGRYFLKVTGCKVSPQQTTQPPATPQLMQQ
jgi:hypothetical protein